MNLTTFVYYIYSYICWSAIYLTMRIDEWQSHSMIQIYIWSLKTNVWKHRKTCNYKQKSICYNESDAKADCIHKKTNHLNKCVFILVSCKVENWEKQNAIHLMESCNMWSWEQRLININKNYVSPHSLEYQITSLQKFIEIVVYLY